MFKRLKAALDLYDYISEVHSYITILNKSDQFGAVMFEKEIVNGKIKEVIHQGSWCSSITGAVLSVTNVRNSKQKGKQNA